MVNLPIRGKAGPSETSGGLAGQQRTDLVEASAGVG
jgi:hypothetical protein